MTGKKFSDLVISINASDMSVPVYVQIKQQVLRYAQEHNFKRGDQLPDISTIAAAAKVSLRSANQAMESLATDGFCFRRPKHGSYFLEPAIGRRKICVVLVSKQGLMDNEIELEYYHGFYSYGIENKIDIASIHSTPEEAFNFYNTLDKVDLCGMVVLNDMAINSTLDLAHKYPKKNFVFLCNRMACFTKPFPQNCYAILNDDYMGGYKIVEYFALQGFRRMAVLSMKQRESDHTYLRRIEGFAAAAKKYGIEFDRSKDLLNCQSSGRLYNQRQLSFLVVREYLTQRENPPGIIFCTNDNLAIGAHEALQMFSGNQQIVVTGYDGLYQYQYLSCKFSTVRVCFSKIGSMALALANNPAGSKNLIEVQPELVIH